MRVRLDRIAEDIFILISGLYAQVTSTVFVTREGAIVVDTMPFPEETRQIISFIEERLGANSVRYVILSHYHADHAYGACFFEQAEIIAHDRCRYIMEHYGKGRLEQAKKETPALSAVELRLPDITFQKEMRIRLGRRTLRLFHTPGHTPDGISVHIPDEKAVIASDSIMPVPYIVSGNYRRLRESLLAIKELTPGFVVQGHGDVLLRGEIDDTIDSSLFYLTEIVKRVRQVVDRGGSPQELKEISIESCGKSRIPLDGLVMKLHLENLVALYKRFAGESGG